MLKHTAFQAIFGLSLVLIWVACDRTSNNPADNFDRKAMLQNYADNLIKPAFLDLQIRVDTLHAKVLAFNANPDSQTLIDLQLAWTAAYSDWQYANAYNFGPAGESGLRKGLIEEIGTFPVNKIKIEETIALAQWNFNDFNRDTRGFLTVEYLLFGENQSPAALVSLFETYPGRRAYLAALSGHLSTNIQGVMAAWSGSYRNDFIENDGTDVGSSTSQLYNEFVRSYESIKNFKLGLPLGKRPGQTQSEPQLVEAYYSGQSLRMLKKHFTAIENIWYGRDKNGQDGIGFREYLEAVEGGKDLIASTETQLAALKAALAAVPDSPPLSAQIAGNNSFVEALYVEFSKMTRYFKSDMSSLLGIAITFSSGDGD